MSFVLVSNFHCGKPINATIFQLLRIITTEYLLLTSNP